MNATETFNFNSKTTTFLHDNQCYFFFESSEKLFGDMSEDAQDALSPEEYALTALAHFNHEAENFDTAKLSGEEAEQFLHVARYYKEHGFYPHA